MTTPRTTAPAFRTAPALRSAARSAAGVAAAAILAGGLLAGCGSGADTDCSLSECTITFERDEEGKASVLGITVELVSATETSATVAVAGQEATIPVDASREISGFTVEVQSITDDQVVVVVSR
jgi:hypothetical protein